MIKNNLLKRTHKKTLIFCCIIFILSNISLFANCDDIIVVEGSVVAVSKSDDPKKSNYKDGNISIKIKLHAILSGNSVSDTIIVYIPSFRNYKKVQLEIKQGSLLRIHLIPYNKAEKKDKEIQIYDDLNEINLDDYIAKEIYKIKRFSTENSVIPFKDIIDHKKIFNSENNLSYEARKSQQYRILKQKEKIDNLIFSIQQFDVNSTIRKIVDRNYISDKENIKKLSKLENFTEYITKDGISFLTNIDGAVYEFYPLYAPRLYPSIDRSTLVDEQLDSIVSLRDFLAQKGVLLVIPIIPESHVIGASMFFSEIKDLHDPRSLYLCKQLLDKGIEAIYFSDLFFIGHQETPYFYPRNGHPNDGCLINEMQALKDVFSCKSLLDMERFYCKSLFQLKKHPNAYYPDLKYPCDIGDIRKGDDVTCYSILYDGEEIREQIEGPVLILSNSFSSSPDNNSLAKYLAISFQVRSSRIIQEGADVISKLPLLLKDYPDDFWKSKRICIVQVANTHITGVRESRRIRFANLYEYDIMMTAINGMRFYSTFFLKSGSIITDSDAENKFDKDGNFQCSVIFNRGITNYKIRVPKHTRQQTVIIKIRITKGKQIKLKTQLHNYSIYGFYDQSFKEIPLPVEPENEFATFDVICENPNTEIFFEKMTLYR